jgi:hypothetical protein
MSLTGFSGQAGVGKTHELMAALGCIVAQQPLRDSQRVLALTFMHGSRRRLDGRLRQVKGLNGRYECTTVDRFGWELVTRWRSLRRLQGLPETVERDYDQTCDTAGRLLERGEVRAWVARSFPVVIVDELQDLTEHRLRIVRALEGAVQMLVAADEFQMP